ncbi:MAG: Glycosyltransferase [Candidatus Peregrinibacteria bacterium GW2011_GWA2_44_7]|nr:MAG: Glycosyltransferase [Candidatus Peregrinibacteria bacterium GW2011_GWA2_44_7]
MDVIYAQGPFVVGLMSTLAARLLRKRLVIKFVGDLTWENAFGQGNTQKFLDEFLEHPDTGWITRLKIKIQKAVFHAADRVVVPSQYLKNVLRTHYALPENKIKVIYNAIELEKLPFKPKSAAHRISLLTIGRLVKWKHVDQIIQALHGLSSEQFHLNIIGEGPEKIHLQRKVKEWDLERKVTFHGSLPHEATVEMLARADVFILNSSYEGLPHTVIEAMLCQTPVIATRIPGTTEIAREAYTWTKQRFNWDENLKNLEKTLGNR